MTTDQELLRRYSENRDEAAFAEVVRRNVNLVYGAALRLTRGNVPMAEEVTQTVFTELARQAGKLQGHPTLAGWLHTCARFTAAKALREFKRRTDREQEASNMNEFTTEDRDVNWAQLRPLLDEAVGQLHDEDREALLLRFFQNKNYRELGELLGLSENTALMRVERALEKLRGRFSRRGVATTAALLVSALGAHGATATAPEKLAASVTGKSLHAATLTKASGILSYFHSHRIKVIAVAILAVGTMTMAILYTANLAAPMKTTNPASNSAVWTHPAPPNVIPVAAHSAVAKPNNDLGVIQIDSDSANLDAFGYKTFTLVSGKLLKIWGELHQDNSILLYYAVQAPGNTGKELHSFIPSPRLLQMDVAYMDTVPNGLPVALTTADGESFSFIPEGKTLDLNDIGTITAGSELPHVFTLHSGKVFVLLFNKQTNGVHAGNFEYELYPSLEAYQAKEGLLNGGGLAGTMANTVIEQPLINNEVVVYRLNY